MAALVPIDFHNPADLQRWQAYIDARPDTHYSDHAHWRLLFEELYGYRNYTFLYMDGENIHGAVSVYLMASPFFGRLLLTAPFFGYGGLYADNEEIRATLLQHIENIARDAKADFVEFRLLEQLPPPYLTNTEFEEFDVLLRDTEEEVWKQVSSNVRQNIRKSRRFELQFSTSVDPDPAFEVISRTVRDLGTPFHDHRFFKLVREYFPEDALFSHVHHDGALVASGLLLRGRDSIATPYIGSYASSRSAAANYCQYWGIVEYCLGQGLRRFELGRSPKNSSNVHFKKKWRPEVLPVYYNYLQLNPRKPYNYSPADPPRTFVLASTVWKRLPLWLTRRLGHRFCRYIP